LFRKFAICLRPPKVLPKLRRLLGDDNSSLDEIVGLIRIEPGIAARLLQVSNSAIYSKGERCSSVDEAVGRVGFQGVYDMVMHAVAAQVLVRPLTTYNLESDTLWRYSVVGGLAAEMLATVTGESRETGYTLGLLHQIGMVAIDGWALRNEPTLGLAWRPFPREYTGSERALLGFTHADVGRPAVATMGVPARDGGSHSLPICSLGCRSVGPAGLPALRRQVGEVGGLFAAR
jgi:hypothetical protein